MTPRKRYSVLCMNDQIRDALNNPGNQIPEIEKTILRLLYVEDKTLDEIAAQLALRRERVRQLKQKALRRLELIKPLTKRLYSLHTKAVASMSKETL